MEPYEPGPEHDLAESSYQAWGVAFFQNAISESRILAGVSGLAGEPIDFGPIGVGPGRLAKVSATGRIGEPTAERLDDCPVRFRVRLPVEVDFTLSLQVDTQRFHARLDVPVILTARALEPLTVCIEVTPPRPQDIEISMTAEGLRATVVQQVADVKGELRRFVAKYVAREVTKPHITAARTIDVLTVIDKAWS